MIAAVCAVVADERAVAEQKQVGIGVEQGAAGVAAEAVDVPSITSCRLLVPLDGRWAGLEGREGRNVSTKNAYLAQRPFLPRGSRIAWLAAECV